MVEFNHRYFSFTENIFAKSGPLDLTQEVFVNLVNNAERSLDLGGRVAVKAILDAVSALVEKTPTEVLQTEESSMAMSGFLSSALSAIFDFR